jgi:hypothetical protein
MRKSSSGSSLIPLAESKSAAHADLVQQTDTRALRSALPVEHSVQTQ